MRNGPYELVVAPNDYPGFRYRGRYCYEHHLIWWRKYGSLPLSNECIHHRNGNKRDNKISNLKLMTISQHNREHAKPVPMTTLICDACGKALDRPSRVIRHQRKIGYKHHYCDRRCMGKMQGQINGKRNKGKKRSGVPQ